ncbi:MAG TPA: TraR/DksA family transcriptional regulator [Rhodospirillaceae bacterium]|nr:TraR/DksA family transcriptional regulator [Rhodospirillaceae bacterium]
MDDIDLATERNEIFISAAVQAVLGRLSGPPSSGVCRSCSEPIEPQRLKLAPSTCLCSGCAVEAELNQQRTRRCGMR